MKRKDCFAYKEKNGHVGCTVSKQLKCENCKFYRNDINRAEIEQDIINYAIIHKQCEEI